MAITLQGLAQAIEGIVVMSQELDSMFYSLMNNEAQKVWNKVGYLSLKGLTSWIRDLKERVKFMSEWLITGFFYPQRFLTGVLQTHARKTAIAIDNLVFSFKVEQNTLMVFLFMDYFQKELSGKRNVLQMLILVKCLCQCHQFISYLYYQEKYQQKSDNYSCPVYKTQTSAGVLSISTTDKDLPTLDYQPPEYWTLRGTALICALKE